MNSLFIIQHSEFIIHREAVSGDGAHAREVTDLTERARTLEELPADAGRGVNDYLCAHTGYRDSNG